MQLRLLKSVVTMLVVLAATVHAPAMARPAQPEVRQPFASELGPLGTPVLNSKAVSSLRPSGVDSGNRALIDAAMTELFTGGLAIRSEVPRARASRIAPGLVGPRQPADWRSQDAWGAFLLEAQQQTMTGSRENSVDAVELQLVSAPGVLETDVTPVSAPPVEVQPLKPVVSQSALQIAAAEPEGLTQDTEAIVRVSASSVEARAIEMIAPVAGNLHTADPSQRDVNIGLPGQITGSVFIDHDGNGRPGRGDIRLEAQPVSLSPLQEGLMPIEHRTAAFGQFGFDALEPGTYLLTVSIGWDEISIPVEIEPGKWSQRVDIAVPSNLTAPAPRSLVAESSRSLTG